MNQQKNISLKYTLNNKSEMDQVIMNSLVRLNNDLKDKFNIKKAKFVINNEEGEEYEIKNQNDYKRFKIALGEVNLKEANLIIKLKSQKDQSSNETEIKTEEHLYNLDEDNIECHDIIKDNRNKRIIKGKRYLSNAEKQRIDNIKLKKELQKTESFNKIKIKLNKTKKNKDFQKTILSKAEMKTNFIL